jgi:hypothetical protein
MISKASPEEAEEEAEAKSYCFALKENESNSIVSNKRITGDYLLITFHYESLLIVICHFGGANQPRL